MASMVVEGVPTLSIVTPSEEESEEVEVLESVLVAAVASDSEEN